MFTVANSDRSIVANVIAADNMANNGVAHIIDAVLLPPKPMPSLAGLVTSVDDLSTLLTAVDKAGLVDTLSGEGTFTVFAPNNEAFAAIPSDDLNALLADTAQLKEVILYHVLAAQVLSTELKDGEQKVDTVSGGALWVTKSSSGVTVANSDRSIVANVIAADNMANNGVAHIIDAVLLPPKPMPSLAGLVTSVDDLSTLLTAVDKAGLVDTLSGEVREDHEIMKQFTADANGLLAMAGFEAGIRSIGNERFRCLEPQEKLRVAGYGDIMGHFTADANGLPKLAMLIGSVFGGAPSMNEEAISKIAEILDKVQDVVGGGISGLSSQDIIAQGEVEFAGQKKTLNTTTEASKGFLNGQTAKNGNLNEANFRDIKFARNGAIPTTLAEWFAFEKARLEERSVGQLLA